MVRPQSVGDDEYHSLKMQQRYLLYVLYSEDCPRKERAVIGRELAFVKNFIRVYEQSNPRLVYFRD